MIDLTYHILADQEAEDSPSLLRHQRLSKIEGPACGHVTERYLQTQRKRDGEGDQNWEGERQ